MEKHYGGEFHASTMNGKSVYYFLQPTTMDACNLTREARKLAPSEWKCEGGIHAKPDIGPINVHISHHRIGDKPLNFVTDGVHLALRSFLNQFGQEILARDLILGKVFGPDGRLNDEWVTYRGRRRIIVRGSHCTGCRTCDVCGRTLYSFKGEPYLYPTPPSDADVFEANVMGMVISESIFSHLVMSPKSKIAVSRVEVIDPPLDGLGTLD